MVATKLVRPHPHPQEECLQVMVTLTDCDERSDEVITRSVLVIERCIAQPVSERVDAESRMVDEKQASCSGKEEAASPVAPQQASDNSGHHKAHANNERQVKAVLPSDDSGFVEVGNIGKSDRSSGLEDHPADVRPEEAFVG